VTYLTLRLLGFEGPTNYDASWQEWGADDYVPVEK
jgi:3-mercaptopyruvate sulfurtransferase SseA